MITAIAVTACSSPEKKAQKLIKEQLKKELTNPTTYKAGA